MKIYLARHGMDDGNVRGGWSDQPLLPEGQGQALALAQHLKARQGQYQIARILSSDLRRAQETAAPIQRALGIPLGLSPALRETNNGHLAGMDNTLALARYPGLFFSSLDMDEPYPGGESPRQFYQRISAAFDEILQGPALGETLLLITHSGVINILYHKILGQPWTNKTKPYPVAHCSLHSLIHTASGWALDLQNILPY